jgi:hypothetical protein
MAVSRGLASLPPWRRAIVVLATTSLSWPAAAAYRDTVRAAHAWAQLRHAHRDAADSVDDATNRALISYLPRDGVIGFSVASVSAMSPADRLRVEQFLQYSLAPRVLVLSTDQTFVIEYVTPDARVSLADDPAFALVASSDDRLRLFRRLARSR